MPHSFYGVLGIGIPNNSSNITSLSNLPARLKMGGIIEKMVYSMYQLSQNSTRGVVLFGAIDYSKFTGELLTVPITTLLEDSMYLPRSRIEVIVNHLQLSNGEKKVNVLTNSYPAVLDSSTELIQVPRALANNLKYILNADNSSSAYVIKCPSDSSLTLDFEFSGSFLSIPVLSLVTSRYAGNCTLGIIPQDQGNYIILGRTFLKGAYVVYDLDDREVSLAVRDFNEGALSSIVVINSLIASAVDAPNYSSTLLGSISREPKATATLKYNKLLMAVSKDGLALSIKMTLAIVLAVVLLVV
ncbi:Aspartyl protease [Scheffersomyces spartinae]|uniref:Aspartyl protease n=1 Tax=Scheffersomyces spartinae TaxID=45513 RepID=A0A9P7VC71_9ASCO|nr:Aspartyl protease [Scheffersomyces spartinae]KAG7195123.1 Aspartyl protease [Scheffersomyces spartinae]